MKNSSKTKTFKNLSLSPPLISSYKDKLKLKKNIKEHESKYEISSLKDNNFINVNNNNNIESQEYNYELDQSNDNNLKFLNNNEESTIERKIGDIIDNNNIFKFYINNNLNYKNKGNFSFYNNIFEKEVEYNNNNLKNKNNMEWNYFKCENEKIKKIIIMQQILINEMKNDIEYLQKEKENMKINFDIQKKNIIEQYESKLNNNIKK